MHDDTWQFWHVLFDDLPEGLQAILSSPITGRTKTTTESWLSAAVDRHPEATIEAWNAAHRNIYVRTTYLPSHFPIGTTRGTAQLSAGMPALWVDLDYGDHGHGKTYPPDLERARMVVETLPHQPTVLVHSGRGVHAWWRFREPWVFADEQEREAAHRLCLGWQGYIRAVMSQAPRRWTLDSTADLARVLRVPGTTNYKYTPPIPCTLLALQEAAYNPSDFEPYLDYSRQFISTTADAVSYPSGTFMINLEAGFPNWKLQQLLSLDERFKRTWQRKRRDMTDQSPSAYDMALCHAGVAFRLNDQQIVDLCMDWRKLHDCFDREKMGRVNYWQEMLARARLAQEVAQHEAQLEAQLDRWLPEGINTPVVHESPERKAEKWQWLREIYGVAFTRLICEMADAGSTGTYIAELEDGQRILYGPIEHLLSQRVFLAITIDAVGSELHTLKRVSEKLWERRAHLLISLREIVRVGPESEGHVMILEWLNEYLSSLNILVEVTTKEERSLEIRKGVGSHGAFAEHGLVWFRLHLLREWLDIRHGVAVKRKELAGWLKKAGAVSQVLNYTERSQRANTRNYWGVSTDLVSVHTIHAKPLKR